MRSGVRWHLVACMLIIGNTQARHVRLVITSVQKRQLCDLSGVMFLEAEKGLQNTVKELVKEALSTEMQQFQEAAAAAGTSKQTQTKSKPPESIFLYITQILQDSRVAGRLSQGPGWLGRCTRFKSRSTRKPQPTQLCYQRNAAYPSTSSWYACRVMSPIFLPHLAKKVAWVGMQPINNLVSSVKWPLRYWLLKGRKAM